jgi:DNA-binding GntR family transcriptional regulator
VTPPVEKKLRKLRKAFEEVARGNPSPAAIRRHIAVDRQLHGLIVDLAGNRRIAQAIEELRDTIQQYRYLGFAAPQRLPRSTREHLGVIDALLRRDAARAEAAMSYHLEEFADDLQECLLSRLRQRNTGDESFSGDRPHNKSQRPRASRGQASARSGP